MKFTVAQNALTQALSIVSKGIASSSTLPILSGVLIEAKDGILEFQSSNYTINIRHRIPAHIDEPGKIVVPCKMLTGITKTLADAPVSFESIDRQVELKCAKSTFVLNTLEASDFPEFPSYAIEKSVELPTNLLSEMVSRVWRVTSTDKARPVLSGVFMTVENNTVRLVATDAFRLAVCETQVETSSLEGAFELNIPAQAFNDALSIMADQPSIMVGSTDTQVVFAAGNTTYVSRRIEGTFPNYRQLLPDSCSTSVKMSVAEFTNALKRVTVVAGTDPAVRFEIDSENGLMTLSANSGDHDEATETFEVEAEGDSGSIAFNGRYVFGCLNALSKEEELTLELKSFNQQGIFKSYDKINYLYLVMPMRI